MMTFNNDMTADVQAPQPRWEYISRKLLEVLGIAFALWLLWPDWRFLPLLFWAGVTHTVISQVLWWTRHPFTFWGTRGRGGLLGDTLYHGWIAMMPFVVAAALVS